MPNLWSVAPNLVVPDVVATANWYRDKLGFHYERFWGEPAAFCIVKRGGASLMLSRRAGAANPNPPSAENALLDVYFWIDNVDALHADFTRSGVKFIRALRNEPYGIREFSIEDCNGYCLAFGQPL
jgi:hypothetical protein